MFISIYDAIVLNKTVKEIKGSIRKGKEEEKYVYIDSTTFENRNLDGNCRENKELTRNSTVPRPVGNPLNTIEDRIKSILGVLEERGKQKKGNDLFWYSSCGYLSIG